MFRSVCLLVWLTVCFACGQDVPYCWRKGVPERTLAKVVAVPDGYRRVPLRRGSFGHWLRHLPLKEAGTPVRLHDGSRKRNQNVHWAVVDLDVGSRDLQQCADAVMRLRAEYLFAAGRAQDICFQFTNGTDVPFSRWSHGERPVVRGNRVSWRSGGRADASQASLRRYLNTIFAYAGTTSLARELKVRKPAELQVGDIFIRGGFPGHAVLIVDVAFHPASGKRVFLLVQSYMPAQDVHVLRNAPGARRSPWYEIPTDGVLRTPEWTFRMDELRRFP